MTELEPGGHRLSALGTAAALVIVVAGLKAAAPVAVPLLFAVFLALLSLPLMTALQERGVRRSLAVTATVLADVAVLSILVTLVSLSVNAFARATPGYVELLASRLAAGLEWLQARLGGRLSFEGLFDGTALVDVAGGLVGGTVLRLATAFSFLLLVVVATLFLLIEASGLRRKMETAARAQGVRTEVLAAVTGEVQTYLVVKTGVSALTGLLVGLWTALLGVEFPLFWGLVAFAFNYVPVLGSIVAGVPAVLVTALQHGLGPAALVAVGYLFINIAIGNILEPQLMGRRLGLSPLAVFLSLMFWGWVWGPLGMILSVPVTVVLRIALQRSDRFRWVAVLLGRAEERPA